MLLIEVFGALDSSEATHRQGRSCGEAGPHMTPRDYVIRHLPDGSTAVAIHAAEGPIIRRAFRL